MATAVLVLAIVLNALMAGLYFAFTTAVMPGLARAGKFSYMTAMQRINVAILNPWFFIAFFGALASAIAAALLHLGGGGAPRLPWIIAGGAAYAATIVITVVVNVPLNNSLMAAGEVTDQTAEAIQQAFHPRWSRFNAVRTVLSLVAVTMLSIALAQPMG